jgi:hypothetical protein
LSVISVAFLVFQRHNVAGLVVDTLEWKMSEIRVLLEHQNLINKPHKTNCLLSAFQPIFSGSWRAVSWTNYADCISLCWPGSYTS